MVDIIPLSLDNYYVFKDFVPKASPPASLPGEGPAGPNPSFESTPPVGGSQGPGPLFEEPKGSKTKIILLAVIGLIVLGGAGVALYIYFLGGPNGEIEDITSEEEMSSEFVNADVDEDGLTTYEEMQAGTDDSRGDTDNDGLPDKYELDNDLNPLDQSDALRDADGDELSNKDEYKYMTNPNNPDSDGDGFRDGDEVEHGYNPIGDGNL